MFKPFASRHKTVNDSRALLFFISLHYPFESRAAAPIEIPPYSTGQSPIRSAAPKKDAILTDGRTDGRTVRPSHKDAWTI